jgi:predicted RNase H-like HicB family nuclease
MKRDTLPADKGRQIVQATPGAGGATDFARLDAMTDEDIAQQIAENPDAAPEATDEWFDQATLVQPRDQVVEYIAELSTEGRFTLVQFPDCPGCQTFAEPGEDVVSVAREALEGWLTVHLDGGDAPPRPAHAVQGTGALAVRIAPLLAIELQLRWRRRARGTSAHHRRGVCTAPRRA